jgi:hypothetical protein
MGRGSLPTYTRLSHVPNMLEAYRYITRRNLTVLASELQMSYHTVRRLCVDYSTPRDTTMEVITHVLPFITKDTWEHWKLLCESALKAEQGNDIVLLTQVEAKLKKMVPPQEGTPPIHMIHECSIDTAHKLHNATLTNKTFSYYLSDLHSDAMDLLSIKRGVTKSELLRLMIDEALVNHPDVMEALVRQVTGYEVEVVPPPEPEVSPEDELIELSSIEDLGELVPDIPVDEIVTQLTQDLPEEVSDVAEAVDPNTLDLIAEPLDFTHEDAPTKFEEWAPSATMSSSSNLTDDEIARLFSGED